MSGANHTPGPVETLARLCIQSERYRTDMEFRDAVDNVLGETVFDAATDLLEAAKIVLAGLLERVDEAPRNAVPVFSGIAALHDAISKAEHSTLRKGVGI